MDTSTEIDAAESFTGLSGRQLSIGKVDNPSGKFKLGLKRSFELFPEPLKDRIEKERKEKFDIKQNELVTSLQRDINECKNNTLKKGNNKPKNNFLLPSELEARLEFLTSLENSDPGPVHDIVLWKDSQDVWRVVVDITETGDLTKAKVLCDYKLERQFDSFGYFLVVSF